MTSSYVVTGGGRGVGRAVEEGLAHRGHVIDYLLSADASFVGAVVPVDGGRAALGQDHEARDVTASGDA